MQTATAHELGYASAAVVAALLDRLIVKGTITGSEAIAILDDAVEALDPLSTGHSAAGAISIINNQIRPQVSKHRGR